MDGFNDWLENEEPSQEDLEWYRQEIYHDPEEFIYERNEDASRRRLTNISNEILDRSPPHSLILEKAILGIYLLHPDERCEHDKIPRDRFYTDAHRKVYSAIFGLRNLDMVLLSEELKRRGDFESVGGTSFLIELYKAGENLNPKHLADYIKLLKQYALRRDLMNLIFEGLRDSFDDQADISKVIGHLISELKAMRKR